MTRARYCPLCRRKVTDEQCPHWDYESDPRGEYAARPPLRAALLACLLLTACASQTERELTRVNDLAKLAPIPAGHSGNCTAHVAAVSALLAGRYTVVTLYTRSDWMPAAHVSAIVYTASGAWLLDNGALQQARDVEPLAAASLPAVARVLP